MTGADDSVVGAAALAIIKAIASTTGAKPLLRQPVLVVLSPKTPFRILVLKVQKMKLSFRPLVLEI